jgi:hypothetical protein
LFVIPLFELLAFAREDTHCLSNPAPAVLSSFQAPSAQTIHRYRIGSQEPSCPRPLPTSDRQRNSNFSISEKVIEIELVQMSRVCFFDVIV